MVREIDKQVILDLLKEVKDPEIPVLSLVDLGVITGVECTQNEVVVRMTPTYSGCPAMKYMQQEVERVLARENIPATVIMNFDIPWSSNRITEDGRKALKQFGLAPPVRYELIPDLDVLKTVTCPYCGGEQTELRSTFGPTLCRSMHYCNSCRQMFEAFKPL